jgi:hypothetical protein
MDTHSEIGVLGSAIQLIDQKGEKNQIVRFPRQQNLIAWRLFFTSPLAHPAVMIRKEALKKLKVLNNHYYQEYASEDYDLWRRMIKITQIENLPEVLLLLRKHPTNLSKVQGKNHLEKTFNVSKTVIRDTLGQTPDLIVQCLTNFREPKSKKEAYQTARLLVTLYQKFLLKNKLTLKEKIVTQFDIIKRLTRNLLSYIK